MGILQGSITFDDKKIFYRESGNEIVNPKGIVLLLHGQKFSSLNWQQISTLEKLSDWNFRAIAIDLPGEYYSLSIARLLNFRSLCFACSFGIPPVYFTTKSAGGRVV